jgi:hypothetical protein
LLGSDGQALALEHGLRPFNSEPDASSTLFVNAQPYGIQLTPDLSQVVQSDGRNTTDAVNRILQ